MSLVVMWGFGGQDFGGRCRAKRDEEGGPVALVDGRWPYDAYAEGGSGGGDRLPDHCHFPRQDLVQPRPPYGQPREVLSAGHRLATPVPAVPGHDPRAGVQLFT